MRKLLSLLPFPLLVLFAAGTLSAGTASIEAGETERLSLELAWNDRGEVRILPGAQEGIGEILLREGEVFIVTEQEGGPLVMNFSEMARIGGSLRLNIDGDVPLNAERLLDWVPTGVRESVAGVPGEIYRLVWIDNQGREREAEAILSDAPLAVGMQEAFARYAVAMAAAAGRDGPGAITERVAAEGLGVLRFGNDYRVTALSADTPPTEAFALPAPPTPLSEIMGPPQE